MATPFQSRRHWSHVSAHFSIDLLFWVSSFLVAALIRFVGSGFGAVQQALQYAPGLILGGMALASSCYIAGLYSHHGLRKRARLRYLLVTTALLVALLVTFSYGSVNFSARVGRGVIAIGLPIATLLIAIHHVWLTERSRFRLDRMVCIVASPADELECRLLLSLPQRYHQIVGCVVEPGYEAPEGLKLLGNVDQLERLITTENIGSVFCTLENRRKTALASKIRQIRYSGVRIVTLSSLCEEVFQAIPIALIDNDWLMNACTSTGHFYNAKLKRAFDVILSLVFMLLLAPFLLLGITLVFLKTGRPIFYSQVRSGKFGREIEITKLRTMNTDAEANGARWSAENDPRVTPIGRFLRRFRIDEIPQLWSVLRGDISFVGPRPERPEFIDSLSKEIPCFKERLMVQPGLTGWAQVNYPYGSSTDDSRRKLEFDLYYMKNLSPLLDAFVLLDTVRIILRGGASNHCGALLAHFEENLHNYTTKLTQKNKPVALDENPSPHG